MKKRLMLIVLFVLLIASQVQAADLHVFVSCVQAVDDNALFIQFGYDASEPGESSMIGYIGDVYVDIDGVEAGRHDYAAEVTLMQGQVLFFIGAWFGGEYSYSEVWADGNTTAPPCNRASDGSGPVTVDDLGQPNDPRVNERANACYAPGYVCQGEAEWEAGWYAIRQS